MGFLSLDVTFYGRDKMVSSLSVAPNKIVMTLGPHCVPAAHNVPEGEAAHTTEYYTALDTEYFYRSNLGFDAKTNEIPETCYFKYMHLCNVQALRFAEQCFGTEGITGLEAFKAYPVITPAYELANAGLDTNYSVSDGVGIYNVSGMGIDRTINVFSESDVEIFGSDRGFDYIVANNTLNIYGNGKIEDSSYAWNEYLSVSEEIIINVGIDAIGENAFDIPGGTSVILPYTLLDISANAFCGKTDFSIIGYEGSGAEKLGVNSFTSLGSAGKCGEDVYFIYKNGTLEILGSGNTLVSGIAGYGDKQSCAWYAHYNDITKAVIGENITAISGRAFHYMPALTTVEITENQKTIGASAFAGGPALTTVYLKGREAISGTVDLSYVTSIGGGAFNDCKKIKNVILSKDLGGAIGANTFQLCSGITELTIPEGVTSIGASAFGDASSLRKLLL